MCEEMKKLREMLDNRNIYWEDKSNKGLQIIRTHFYVEGIFCSVIWGFGTYGFKDGLLEFMVDKIEPIGNLTALNVISIIDVFQIVKKTISNLEYRRGLDDAWKCAERICSNDALLYDRGLREIFGTDDAYEIIKTYTASQAIGKLLLGNLLLDKTRKEDTGC